MGKNDVIIKTCKRCGRHFPVAYYRRNQVYCTGCRFARDVEIYERVLEKNRRYYKAKITVGRV